MTTLPEAAERILEEGVLCYLASPSPAGPHTTPVVFSLEGGRIWGTTGRRTTKAKLWRREPFAGGLVQAGERALAFRGRVKMYDLLAPTTWPASVVRSPRLTLAAARFTAKNARFFAGYARDAAGLPFSWTPPARILFSVDVASGAVIDGGRIVERWGSWGTTAEGPRSFRAASGGIPALPEEVSDLLDEPREAVLAMPHADGPVVLPVRATGADGAVFATLPRALVELADARGSPACSLVVDEASAWRAAKMRGVMLRGPGSVYLMGSLERGAASLRERVGDVGEDDAVVAVRSRSAVWWVGWSSGTVTAS